MEEFNPNDHLFKRIKSKDKEISNSYDEFKKKELISFTVFMAFAVAALSALTLSLPVFLSMSSMATLLGVYKYKSAKKYDDLENRLNQEKSHLLKLLEKTPDVSEEAIDKRKKKILGISNIVRKTNINYQISNEISAITYALTTIGALLTFFNPACVWIPIAGIVSSVIAGNNEIEKNKKFEIIKNRINNLDNDLDFIDLITDEDGNLLYEVKDLNEVKETKKDKVRVSEEAIQRENNYFENCIRDMNNNKVLKKVR